MMKIIGHGTIIAATTLLAWASIPSMAQAPTGHPGGPSVNIGIGSGAAGGIGVCAGAIREIRNHWFDIKRFMDPNAKSLRPRTRDFACVAPQAVLDSMERTFSPAGNLRCFTYHNGQEFCCDRNLRECATKSQQTPKAPRSNNQKTR